MSLYVDTNVVVQMYLNPDGSGRAHRLLTEAANDSLLPVPVADLLKMEIINAIERTVFESRNGGQWRVSEQAAAASLSLFDDHLEDQNIMREVAITSADIEPLFKTLSLRHTAKYGFRTYDIMHVAFALTLGCSKFFSFDKKALQLARLEGLETN